ncbi:MAG: peroxiredoxin [Methanocalculus sp.]|uniref:peroxiredoxin n=1 Tax=Methanocalculus sp. TaxID=2004547 RepID=UPI002719D4BC|nr:peroxiredoxin [Methanocalculus sp.]MDO9539465.1 peroxiredoxin [Methanocalculus sp.]
MCDDMDMYCDCEPRMPMIGEEAPDFEAVTTHGPMKLSDFKDKKWVVLFSHPADFTPVCTTEFIALSEAEPEFAALNAQLVGLSIDSIHSHLAWVKSVKDKMGVAIPFPIIADLDMKVASLFGMIHPNQSSTAAVRAVFFIDPSMIVRCILYYPLTNGRYIPELVRLLKAFQTSDQYSVATPANWQPGDKVVVPAPKTVEQVELREKEGYECKDWYLCFKQI